MYNEINKQTHPSMLFMWSFSFKKLKAMKITQCWMGAVDFTKQ